MAEHNLLMDNSAGLPYRRNVQLQSATSEYKVSLKGVVSPNPIEFAVEVREGDNILVHVNPRWTENRVVLNTCDATVGWGAEDTCELGIAPNSEFWMDIIDKHDSFLVNVNGRPVKQFMKRIRTVGMMREVQVIKVQQGDVRLHFVRVDEMAMMAAAPGLWPMNNNPAFGVPPMAPSAPMMMNPGGFGSPMGGFGMQSQPLIFAASPGLPFAQTVQLPTPNSEYKVTIRGSVSANPQQFSIDIREGQNILLHMNPRWTENRTVFNSCINHSFGAEETLGLPFPPNSPFLIEITDKNDMFLVNVNGQPWKQYKKRCHAVSASREIQVGKANQQDIRAELIQLEVVGGMPMVPGGVGAEAWAPPGAGYPSNPNPAFGWN